MGHRSYRVFTRLQCMSLPNMISVQSRSLYRRLAYLNGTLFNFFPGMQARIRAKFASFVEPLITQRGSNQRCPNPAEVGWLEKAYKSHYADVHIPNFRLSLRWHQSFNQNDKPSGTHSPQS